MVNYCLVFGCTKRLDRETDFEFYRLPKVITNQGEASIMESAAGGNAHIVTYLEFIGSSSLLVRIL